MVPSANQATPHDKQAPILLALGNSVRSGPMKRPHQQVIAKLCEWLSHRNFLSNDFQRKNPGGKILFGMWRIKKSVGDLSQNHFSVTIGLVIGSGGMR